MKITLLSDTHGYLDNAIKKHLQDCDEIWHAGDIGSIEVYDELSYIKPLRAVFGNIDGSTIRKVAPLEQYFECEGQKVYIIHIGGYPPNYTRELKNRLLQLKPTIFICGHSHILKVIYDKKLNCLHMNPGAAGIYGFHKVRTLIKFEINSGKIENMNIVELAQRN